ncbi:hypothetical protein ACQZ6C_27495 [Rhizobium rhizogenes]
MSRIEILNTEFPGQTAWQRFSDCYADVDISERDAVAVDADIAQVLVAKLGTAAQANKWLQKPLPALDGASVLLTKSDDHSRHRRASIHLCSAQWESGIW